MITVFAAASLTAFNLVCAGNTHQSGLGAEPDAAYRIEYRIDLATKRFCIDDCSAVTPIANVRTDKLVFSQVEVDTISHRELGQDVADRSTGEHARFILTGRGVRQRMIKWIGRCERAPFTGFPASKQRF
ncbi:hypothetical protein [Sphingomonas sp.]|uniref:hypothetical protein n=1 Tax=Sphingomonas sp. TaxID=28214 RepID=UPI0035A8684D